MELVKLNHPLPVKAYPEADLNRIILTEFTPWIARLLSLTGETSAERLEVALPSIKEHCWSMGFNEIKKMFEMYADNKLSIEPRANYFDRILFGRIVSAYKQQLPTPKNKVEVIEMSEEDKQLLVYTGLMNCFEEYKEWKVLPSGCSWVYDHFYEKGKLPYHSAKFRSGIRERAIKKMKSEHMANPDKLTGVQKFLANIQKDGSLKVKCKEIIVSDWFDELIENNIDIKTEL